MRSIRVRLLTYLIFGTVLVLLLGGGGLYWLVEHTLIRQQDRLLESRARSLAPLVSFSYGRVEVEQDEDLRNSSSDILFRIEDLQGAILWQSSSLLGVNLNESMTRSQSKIATATFFNVTLPDDDDGRAVSMVFEPQVEAENETDTDTESAQPPKLLITVASSTESIDQSMTVLVSALSVIGLMVLATIVGVLWLGIRSALSPLDRLGHDLKRTDAVSPEYIPFPPRCPDELVPVYQELDMLIVRIRSAMERERLFTDAVAHELRTPLAELRTGIEVAERWPEDGQLQKALAEAGSIAVEMEGMVASLLAMTRSRILHSAHGEERVLLAPIAKRILDKLQDQVRSQNLHTQASIDPQAAWPTSPEIAELLLRNLIDNAVIHTPPGGTVHLKIKQLPKNLAELVVENQPVDLTPEDIKQLAWPFWRKDKARSDRTHVGLGLSVVQRLAHAIGLEFSPSLDSDKKTLSIRIAPITTECNEYQSRAYQVPDADPPPPETEQDVR